MINRHFYIFSIFYILYNFCYIFVLLYILNIVIQNDNFQLFFGKKNPDNVPQIQIIQVRVP